MQISKNLPQFEDDKTLIIVASTQSADIYIAHAGEINNVAEIRTEKIDYDDQAGHFERKSHGKTLGSGGVEKDETQKLKERFQKNLQAELANLKAGDITQIILLSSPQDKSATKELVEDSLQEKVEMDISGNYVGDHPDDILEKIKQEENE